MEEEANVAAQDLSIAPKYASPPTTCYLVGGSCLNINNRVAPWEYNLLLNQPFRCFYSNNIANNNHVAQGGKLITITFDLISPKTLLNPLSHKVVAKSQMRHGFIRNNREKKVKGGE
jgi:hypothetical protein